jgi:hypothetical protein
VKDDGNYYLEIYQVIERKVTFLNVENSMCDLK